VKSPAQLAARWRKQWQAADTREQRLLDRSAWPIALSIGKPTATEFVSQGREVREHVQLWRAVKVGEVKWERVSYRSGGDPVEIPTNWILRTPDEWVAATEDRLIELEYHKIASVLAQSEPLFHRTLVRQLRIVANAGEGAALQAVSLVRMLEPGCADGRPLRALAFAGIDSKFIERNRTLVQQLLDARFDGQASEQGLESFLGALDEGDHWLLVAPLEPGLLRFARQSIPANDLVTIGVPGTHLLIVENERSLHQLPQIPATIAVLGSGLNLAWMKAPWLASKAIGYWGDIDTWGLTMLATARAHQRHLDALLMTLEVFVAHEHVAVSEPCPAAEDPPEHLCGEEQDLFRYLRRVAKGRLEQEFLPREMVEAAVNSWRSGS
jgi:hypothetical protein